MPTRTERFLARDRLVRLIDSPYQAKVTTITAGAGFGKSTLAWHWAQQSTKRVCWLSLEPVDDDAPRFLKRLISAWDDALAPATPVRAPSTELVTTEVSINLVADYLSPVGEDMCLVLDNCQVLHDVRCMEILNGLVAGLPATVCLMLLSRRPLPVRLSRLRSQGQVRDVSASDLRFSPDEVRDALALQSGTSHHAQDIDRISDSIAGWGVGLAFAGLARLRPVDDDLHPEERQAVQERFLDEYILEEVIEPLEPDLREVLLAMVDLPFVSPELCDAVFEEGNGSQVIARLVRDVPFLDTVEGTHRIRLAPILYQSLRRIVGHAGADEARAGRLLRAAMWLVAQGEPKQAAGLALASNDNRVMVHVFSAVCRYHADRSQLETVVELLELLPPDTLAMNLNLPYWWIVGRLGLGRTAGVSDLIDEIEPRWLASGDPLHTGRASLCRGMLAYYTGDTHETERRLSQALERLPRDAHVERLYAATYLGRSSFQLGTDDTASTAFDQANACAAHLPIDEQWSWRELAAGRANAYALRADLPSAITKYRMMLSELPDALSDLRGFVHCRLVALHLERHDMAAAQLAIESAEVLVIDGQQRWRNDLVEAKARLLLATGQVDAAEALASGHVRNLRRLPHKTQMVLLLASIWLERREFSMVQSWLADLETVADARILTFGDMNHRLLSLDFDLAEGRLDQAAQSAQKLSTDAAVSKRWSEFIAFSMRWAVALHRQGRFHLSHDVVRGALERGAPGGFVRHYLVPGTDVVWMFGDVWDEKPEFARIRHALRQGIKAVPDPTLTPLTKRELEVLQLVAKGRGNQQIADTMYISINTVRNHLVNICRRLDARSRLEAVVRARDLGILD